MMGLPNTLGGGNSPPQLAGFADKIVTLGQTLSFTASASDPEAPPQTLSFSLEANIPAGAIALDQFPIEVQTWKEVHEDFIRAVEKPGSSSSVRVNSSIARA